MEEKVEKDYVEMSFLYHHLGHFARWLLMMGKSATVVEPEDLKILIRKQIQELTEHHC